MWCSLLLIVCCPIVGGRSTSVVSVSHTGGFTSEPLPAKVDVYAEPVVALDAPPVDPGPQEQLVELLRFVTAYKTGLESLVDITPYSPLISTHIEANKDLTFYTFIDSWVSNHTSREVLYMNNVTGRCSNTTRSDGNGWSVSMDLVLWPRDKQSVDTRPRESLTLATGFYGATYPFGDITVLEGKLDNHGGGILLNKATDFEGVVGEPIVYACPRGAKETQLSSLLSYAAQNAQVLSVKHGAESKQMRELNDMLVDFLVAPQILAVKASTVFTSNNSVVVEYDNKTMKPEIGMPIFYNEADLFTDQLMYGSMWWNSSYPFKPAGNITSILSNRTMLIKLDHPCLPKLYGETKLPRLLVPQTSHSISDAKQVAAGAIQRGVSAALKAQSFDMLGSQGLGVYHKQLGHVDLNATNRLGPKLSLFRKRDQAPNVFEDGGRACVVVQKRQGHLFSRGFNIPHIGDGERVVMQLAATGHGWASTSSQCGEYCHAVYHLSINGRSAHNISEFRDDCKKNPNRWQYGTWDESRNGWCPGSVSPGLFVDVTKHLRNGTNRLEFDVTVWSNETGKYERYTDFAGFAFSDQATLSVGLTLFVYDAPAVAAIVRQKRSFTAAEAALRNGSSAPEQLRPVDTVVEFLETDVSHSGSMVDETAHATEEQGNLLQESYPEERMEIVRLRNRPRRSRALSFLLGRRPGMNNTPTWKEEEVGGKFDFLARAPWYGFNQTREGANLRTQGAVSLRVFEGSLMQGAQRQIRATIKAHQLSAIEWDRAALHLTLQKPHGLEFDHWDREASTGLVLHDHKAGVRLHLPSKSKGSQWWRLRPQ